MPLQFATYPKSEPTIPLIHDIVFAMQSEYTDIDSSTHEVLTSNDVLAVIRTNLESLGFEVERDKSAAGKIKVPVLFGLNGKAEKTFDADAYHRAHGVVMEVEAGRAVTNYQFLKDLFQACMMHDVKHLVVAVRNIYRTNKDFETVVNFFETLYASARIQLPLKSITVIGY